MLIDILIVLLENKSLDNLPGSWVLKSRIWFSSICINFEAQDMFVSSENGCQQVFRENMKKEI
jgi:hypothetical protein